MIEVLQHYASDLLYKSGEHLYISMLGLLLAILVAVPIGILITRVPKIANVVVDWLLFYRQYPHWHYLPS